MDAPFNETEAQAWSGFLRTYSTLMEHLEAALRKDSGLSHGEYEVLLRLNFAEDGRMRLNALAERSILSQSGTSRLVSRLEQAGFVERVEVEEDRRGANAQITEEGRIHFLEAAQRHTARVKELFLDRLTVEEVQVMAQAWQRLNETPEARGG